MKQTIMFIGLCVFAIVSQAACLDNEALKNLKQSETDYLSTKIPPAFKHGLEAGEIQLVVSANDSSQACEATLAVTVPNDDIKEASAVLDAQPAKKIMLAAQGYSLPTQTTNQANFSVDASTLKVSDEDILQTSALGKLRASLELMYAFITQKRAEIQPNQQNTKPWSAEIKTAVINSCTKKQSQAQCACVADEYAKIIPAKQMEYIQNINTNPYAVATGANQAFDALKKQVQQTCAG